MAGTHFRDDSTHAVFVNLGPDPELSSVQGGVTAAEGLVAD
jgi:hypothetical protein